MPSAVCEHMLPGGTAQLVIALHDDPITWSDPGQPNVWHPWMRGVMHGPQSSYYQAGRDPAYDPHSPGFLLMSHSIRSAIAEGATEYRFGRGDEAFKARFASEDPGLESVALSRGMVGAATYAAGRAARFARRFRR